MGNREQTEAVLERLHHYHSLGRATPRKLRLWVCARLRCSPRLVRTSASLRAVQIGERWADGHDAPGEVSGFRGLWNDIWLALHEDAFEAAVYVAEERPWCDLPGGLALLEELLGPDELLAFSSNWRTPEVLGIAGAAYDDRTPRSGLIRRPGRLVLADALLDAGCQDPTWQRHLRSWARHPAGCWAMDAILDRS